MSLSPKGKLLIAYFIEEQNKWASTNDICNGTGLTEHTLRGLLRFDKLGPQFERRASDREIPMMSGKKFTEYRLSPPMYEKHSDSFSY